jgi:hypothetical protein
MGGQPLRFPSGNTGEITIAFTQPGDTINFYVRAAAASSNTRIFYSIDGAALTNVALTDTTVRKITLSGLSNAAHTLRIRTQQGSPNPQDVNLFGREQYLSTQNELRFIPAGARAWSTDPIYWTRTGAYGPLAMLPIIGAEIVLATFGGNESFSVAQDYVDFQTRCQTFANVVVAYGGTPVFIGKPYMNASYYSVIAALNAQYNGVPSYFMGIKPEATAISDGEQAADGLHWLAPWHAREGQYLGDWLYDTLLPILGVLT